MIITCTNCSTKFSVPDAVIPTTGRNVKCSKCANIWHVEKSQEMIEKERMQKLQKKIFTATPNLPAVRSDYGNLAWIFSFILLSFLTIGINIVTHFHLLCSIPINHKLLSKFDLCTNNQFKLQDIRIQGIQSDKTYSVNLKYKIQNNADKQSETPWIRIKFFDKNDKVFYTHMGTNDKFKFQPKQIVPSKAQFKNLKYKVEKIEIALGNKIELYTY